MYLDNIFTADYCFKLFVICYTGTLCIAKNTAKFPHFHVGSYKNAWKMSKIEAEAGA